jgi:hypothetical protein
MGVRAWAGDEPVVVRCRVVRPIGRYATGTSRPDGCLANPLDAPVGASPVTLKATPFNRPDLRFLSRSPGGIEPPTPSLPRNNREPLCTTPFSQVTRDRRCQSYRFPFRQVMRSLSAMC